MDAEILKELISELLDTKEMLVVIDSAGAISEMDTSEVAEPEFHDEWAAIESHGWHLHLNMNSVDGVQFVEAEDQRHDSIPRLYYVRFSDAEGRTIIRFYFPNPWRDDNRKPAEFQPEKLRFFEQFRDRYVERVGISFDQRLAT